MARAVSMFLLAGAARALRGHRLHHLARPSRTVMSAATLARTTPTKLSDAEAFLKDIDVFIFDCDGVIWKGDSLIDKVPSVLELLRKLGKKIFFVTNNSTKSRKGYKGKFEKLGLDVEPEEIFSSSFAAAAYLERYEAPRRWPPSRSPLSRRHIAPLATSSAAPTNCCFSVWSAPSRPSRR